MPGPSATESRWAPTTIVRSLLPLRESAITLYCAIGVVVASTTMWSGHRAACAWASSSPTSLLVMAAGMSMSWRRRDEERRLAALEAVVEDQRRGGARVLGVLVLLHERAGAALHQRDRARRIPAKSAGSQPLDRRARLRRAAESRCCPATKIGAGHVTAGRELGHDVVGVLDPGLASGLVRSSVDGRSSPSRRSRTGRATRGNRRAQTVGRSRPRRRSPGDVAARLPSLAVAICWNARSCSKMPSTVTPLRSLPC